MDYFRFNFSVFRYYWNCCSGIANYAIYFAFSRFIHQKFRQIISKTNFKSFYWFLYNGISNQKRDDHKCQINRYCHNVVYDYRFNSFLYFNIYCKSDCHNNWISRHSYNGVHRSNGKNIKMK